MGFKDAKEGALRCLRSGDYAHAVRDEIDVKNLLACGLVTEEDVIALINRTKGNQHEERPHDNDRSVTVHIFKPQHKGVTWYIKFYFVEPGVMFISVHP
ncbi:MAG: hypothetical protein OET90_01620 [Desulfuromonadales bacterium]|nr:hypothetical protein [Desulfuromonadales bacterium]